MATANRVTGTYFDYVPYFIGEAQWYGAFAHSGAGFLSGLAGASLFAPVALWLDFQFEGLEESSLLLALVDEWNGVVFPVTIAWVLMNLPLIRGFYFAKSAAMQEITPPISDLDTASAPVFMSMSNVSNIGEIEAITAELHYISINTGKTAELLLYSLKDAVNEMPEGIGFHIHRSHWVSFSHIENVKKQGRQGQVIMRSGNKHPVSRNQFAAFEKAWSQFKLQLDTRVKE